MTFHILLAIYYIELWAHYACLARVQLIMKNFKNIKYIINNELLNISIRQLRRRAKELLSVDDKAVKVIKNSYNRDEYLIDIHFLNKFQRIRAPKKIISKTITNSSSIKVIKNHYDTNISINIKSDDIAYSNTYDYNYNDFIANEIFKTVNKDIYYVIEKECLNTNHFHLHIGLRRGASTLKEVKNKIKDLLFNKLLISNNNYTDNSKNIRKVLYVENMVSDLANRQYLAKGDDHLGGIIPKFLTTKKYLI